MNITKLFNTQKKNAFGVLLGLGLVVLVVVLVQYNSDKSRVFDGMTDSGSGPAPFQPLAPTEPPTELPSANTLSQESYLTVGGGNDQPTAQPANMNPSELLPSDSNSEWASINPASNDFQNVNLLTAGQLIGINTVGQCHKNSNPILYRPEPVIAKQDIGPWNQSTNDCNDPYRRTQDW